MQFGGLLVRVIGSWREARNEWEAGSDEWLGVLPPAQHAFVCLAGRAAAEGDEVLVPNLDSDDEQKAARLVSASVLERLRGEVLAWTYRRDVARQITLAFALLDRPVISGVEAERIICSEAVLRAQ